jgi:predicted Co/Zn/Cd cation transporter (cation efflux family)
MKPSSKYESIAAVLALVGAVALVAVYYPILNPVQFGMDTGRDRAPLGRYILGTPASLFILAAAWHFNRKAMRLKREEQDVHKPSA